MLRFTIANDMHQGLEINLGGGAIYNNTYALLMETDFK